MRHGEKNGSNPVGPVRVLRVIARLNIGGPAIQAVSLTRELDRGPFRSLLVCGDVEPHEGDMSYLALEQGVRPQRIEGLGREISPLKDIRVLYRILGVIHRFRPHIIHTHTAKAGTLGRAAGILWNLSHPWGWRVRLVHTFHGHVFHSYFGRIKTGVFLGIERFLGWFTDRIVVISRAQKNDICERYGIVPPRKARVVCLGFDLSGFAGGTPEQDRAARRDLLSREDAGDAFLVGFVGRLAPVKHPGMLLAAAARLKERGLIPEFRFVIVGDGELRAAMERETRKQGLSEYVIYAGWRRRMAPVYRALNAVALTSLNEGTPVCLIEAMAAGRPVAATAVGGVPDLLGGVEEDLGNGVKRAERGLLIRSGDDLALAHALACLRDRGPGIAASTTRARDYALSTFGMERLVSDVKGLYREVMEGP